MKRPNHLRLIVTLFGALAIAACGGSTPPKPAAETPAPASEPAAAASADAGATPEPATTAATAPTTPPPPDAPPAAGVLAQGHEECGSVSAPFEEKVRAKFNECYQAGKKKNPELAGTIKVTLKIDMKGKIKYVPEPSKLDKAPYDCMVSAVKKEKFDAKACKGKDVTVEKTFGQG